MFDVFYTGPKPNRFPFEVPAESIEQAAVLSRTKFFWYIYGGNDYTDFNFDWVPPPWEDAHVHVFPSQWQRDAGVYFANKHTAHSLQWHYRTDQQVNRVLANDIFFIDSGNPESSDRFAEVQAKYHNAQKVRYANSMFETIKRCANRATTPDFWIIHSHLVYTNFNFTWHPDASQQGLLHVFPSQWNKWSDTFLINKTHFQQQAQWHQQLEQFADLNFVEDQYVQTADDTFDIYYVDHGNPVNSLVGLKDRYPRIRITRFVDNYLDTFKRIVNTATSEYIWITSSICDYTDFDFTWKPEPWQSEMVHVFPSGTQKRGDTFYIHVPSFKEQIVDLALLDWFNVINYCDDQWLDRLPAPHHYYDTDDLITEIKNYHFDFPYAVFSNQPDNTCIQDICLWNKKDRIVHGFTRSGAVSVIPRDIKSDLHTQIYDYPYVNAEKNNFLNENPQEIIFISYDEPDADANWEIVKNKHPRAKRLHGVQGMERALEAAAEMSETPWYFAVFAKTALHEDFDFEFQPDYWQVPKHYIFHAKNRVNGLSYGHMGVVMYNCNLILNNRDSTFGLDYTLSFPHEVVPIVSAYGNFDTSPYHTWRTTFREVSKLYDMQEKTPSIDTAYRIKIWETKAEGEFAEWALNGAADGREFYLAHKDDYDARKNTFNWVWLREYFVNKYGDIN